MKHKKIIIAVLIAVLLTALIVTTLMLLKFNHDNKIFNDKKKQIEVLVNLYTEFLSYANRNNHTVVLGESAIKNLTTKKIFEEEEKVFLKDLEHKGDSGFTYFLSVSYNDETRNITLSLKEENGLETKTQKYHLKVKNDSIIYDRIGASSLYEN